MTVAGTLASSLNGTAGANILVASSLIDLATGAGVFSFTGTPGIQLFASGALNRTVTAGSHGSNYVTNATFDLVSGTSYEIVLTAATIALATSNAPGYLAWAQAYISGQVTAVTLS